MTMLGKRPGRPQRHINPSSPYASLAEDMVALKDRTGLNIRQFAFQAGYSPSAISEATNGDSLPSLDLLLDYVRVCGESPEPWAARWQQLAAAQLPPSGSSAEITAAGLDSARDPVHITVGSSRISAGSAASSSGISSGGSCHVGTASGQTVRVSEGWRLIFGRGPDVDLVVSADRGLSRRAGMISNFPGGAWIANISHTHALYIESAGHRIRLPRMETDDGPACGWLLHAGAVLVGSRVMLDTENPLTVLMPERKVRSRPDCDDNDGEGTLLPLYLDPMTKLFLVALMWCRPWLLDPSATTPLPRTPEIAWAALEATGAHHELERFEADPEFRDRLSARVAEHLKVLRRKIADRGLVPSGVRLSDDVAVRILIEHGIITPSDLDRLSDPAWCSRQEDLWWAQS